MFESNLPRKNPFADLANLLEQGIPHGCRARAILFQQKTIQAQTNKYPAIGQKKINGAASRLMIFFMALLSSEIEGRNPNDVNRWAKFHLLEFADCDSTVICCSITKRLLV